MEASTNKIQLERTSDFVVPEPHVGIRRVLTYGTFDLLHFGHIRLLQRAASLGDYLIVALSTDEFNAGKGKTSFYPYEVRREMLEAIRYVDLVIPENSWEQKLDDVRNYHVDVVCMGGDWVGSDRFEYLREACELVYLDRTPGISTTQVKNQLGYES
ncbi:glycerol-3-phosphate cytidylyltransferase [Curtanaerobium respiraculi]|uniref:glycerol-3-phosphate cytidylyltransferase n=1 Tax=Curtanaerobium respiraculi TaxID=2949669 RepID=UPI003204D879